MANDEIYEHRTLCLNIDECIPAIPHISLPTSSYETSRVVRWSVFSRSVRFAQYYTRKINATPVTTSPQGCKGHSAFPTSSSCLDASEVVLREIAGSIVHFVRCVRRKEVSTSVAGIWTFCYITNADMQSAMRMFPQSFQRSLLGLRHLSLPSHVLQITLDHRLALPKPDAQC
jgi:hypothetical protein